MATTVSKQDRVRGMLLGMFVADALAMPVHWYYNTASMRRDYGTVTAYLEPKPHHPESMTDGMSYNPEPSNVLDIMHDKRELFTLPGDKRRRAGAKPDEHGNRLAKSEEERTHYHKGLHAGENTAPPNALIRTLLTTTVKEGKYSPDAYIQAFRDFFLTPHLNTDTYCERFVRLYFEAASRGAPPLDSATEQRDVWSVASHSSLQGPLVLAAAGYAQGLSVEGCTAVAIRHHSFTHKGPNIRAATRVLVPLVYALLDGRPLREAVEEAAAHVHTPKVTGKQLVTMYRDHKGPGNIPADKVWQLHTDLHDEPFDVRAWSESKARDEELVGLESEGGLSTMCYVEHGVPAVLLFLHRHPSFLEAVQANIHVGGDSTGRGVITGALAGAAFGSAGIPDELVRGLYNGEAIEKEVNAFVGLVFNAEADVFTDAVAATKK